MKISSSQWAKYQNMLVKISHTATREMKDWILSNGGYSNIEFNDAIAKAYEIATKYGEASAATSALMYDAIAELSNANVPTAEVAETVSLDEVKKTIYGASSYSQNDDYIAGTVGRMTKQAGADTTLKNAKRDGAEFAWIASGDTCTYCELLSSMGWRNASAKTIKGDHAEHIHANCDCQFVIRFDKNTTVEGYNPDLSLYDNTPGKTIEEKANYLRNNQSSEKRIKYNASIKEKVPPKVNESFSAFGKKWGNAKTEHAYIIDKDGNVVWESKSGKGKSTTVQLSGAHLTPGSSTVHNHPIPGTFSPGDVLTQEEYGSKYARIYDSEGNTYTLINPTATSKIQKENCVFYQAYADAVEEYSDSLTEKMREYRQQLVDEGLSKAEIGEKYSEWLQQNSTYNFMNKWLEENASKYGWTYIKE